MFRNALSRQRNVLSKFSPRLEILEDRCVPATRTWDGGALSNNWSNASNWQGNIAPVAGDDLVFPAGNFDKTADNDYTNGTHFRSITLGGGYTLRGNRVFLGIGGVIDNSGTSNIIKNDLDFGASGGSRNFQIGTGSTLFLDGVLQGSNGFNKLGTGNLSLRANNEYTGITAINAGALFIEKDESLGQGVAGTNIFTGATLVVNDQALGAIRTDETFFVQHNGTIRGINDVELRGVINTLGTTLLKHDGSIIESMKISGVISGAGGISVIPGTGKVQLNGTASNSYQGTTTVSGMLILDTEGNAISGDLTIISGGLVRYQHKSHQINDSATVTITGTGKLQLDAQTDTVDQLVMIGGELRTNSNSLLEEYEQFIDLSLTSDLHVNTAFVATSFDANTSARLDYAGVVLNGGSTFIVNDGPAFNDLVKFRSSITGSIRNAEGRNVLIKSGPGTLFDDGRAPAAVNQPFVHTEAIIEEGTYRVVNEKPGYQFRVRDGGRYSGGTTIGALFVEAGGRVAPGPTSATGILKLNNDLLMDPGSIIEATFNGTNAGSQHDQIDVEGNVNVEGAILEATLGAGATVGQTYKLINNNAADAIVGSFFLPPVNAPFLIASPTGQRLAFNYQGGTFNNDLVLTLSNTPPKAPDLALNTTEINEGGTVTATGSLVDPDAKDKLRLFINWGDGSRQEVHRPGRDLFSFTHRYRHDGVYTARFEWIDQTGQGNSREFTITVNNVAPALKLRTFRTFSTGLLLASGWLSDAGDDRYTATLDFGDGTSRTKTLNRRDYLAIAYKYRNPGNYTLTLTLIDSQGAESVYQRQVVIQ